MKQVWLSLFLVTMFTIACSGSETTENNTKQRELTSTPDPTEDVAVAITTSATEHPEGEIIGNEAATNAATASPTPENVSSTQPILFILHQQRIKAMWWLKMSR